MKNPRLLVTGAIAAILAGCGSDGVDLNVSTVDNSTDNSTHNNGNNGSTNPCASYTEPGTNTVRQGQFDGTNCIYNSAFVGVNKPLTVDLTIPFISGVHIFQDSLFVGEDVATGTAPAAGTGPTLTIEAGNTLAFTDAADYLLINRGSRIMAIGSAAAPITLTGYADAVTGTAGPEDVQLWGGLVINGNGITNNCTDAQRAADQCHVVSEGQPSHYGGADNTESSGELRYLVVKHTGFEVAPGDELNGITFNAVGSGTVVENVQVYSTYDDGVEFFGGAVNVRNLVALYVRDDSIDFSDGYVGTIENALVIQSATNGNRCIEGDNISDQRSGSGESRDTAPVSNPTIRNMTCILSSFNGGTHGDSEGIRLREGARASIIDSILFGGYATTGAADSECLQIQHTESLNAAAAGESVMQGTIIACEQPTSGTFANNDPQSEWVLGASPSTNGADYSFNTENRIFAAPSPAASPALQILEPDSFYTAPAFADETGTAFEIGSPARAIGAVLRADDWTTNWTYGLRAPNRGQPLWFE